MDDGDVRLSELPQELHIIADFLAVDDRLAAILHAPKDGRDVESQLKLKWRNEAFERLSNPNAEIEDLQNAVARSLPVGSDLATLHGRLLAGGRWHTRVSKHRGLGDYCIVTASDKIQSLGQVQRASKSSSPPAIAHSADNGAPAGAISPVRSTATSSQSKSTLLDWTRHDVPGLSAYAQFFKDFDWSHTSLGPIASWPDVLRRSVLFMIANPNPRLIIWGDGMNFLYNEACVPLFGAKHPGCLGHPVKEGFAEAWEQVQWVIDAGYRGEVTKLSQFPLPIQRRGYLEVTYWDFTTLPIIDGHGFSIGVYDELTESTSIVTGKRRRATITALTKSMNTCSTLSDLWPAVMRPLEANPNDLPFAILFSVAHEASNAAETDSGRTPSSSSNATKKAKKCVFVASTGLSKDITDIPTSFTLSGDSTELTGLANSCNEAWKSGLPVTISAEDGSLPSSLAITSRSFGNIVRQAKVLPIKALAATGSLAILVIGLDPSSPLTEEYEIFQRVAVELIEKNAALISVPEEQRRAQKISDEVNDALAEQLRATTLKAEKSEAKFSRLASTAPTGMFMFDSNGKPLYVNDTYLEMLGVSRTEHGMKTPDKMHWKDQVHEDDLDKFVESWKSITERKVPTTIEYRLKKPWQSTDRSGQKMTGETWLLATAFPEIGADGRVSAVQGWLTDISHRKFSEQLLAQRLEDALESKRQTENFIDMTSHEMRNPLSAILQSADSIESQLNSTGMPIIDESMTIPAAVAEDIVDAAQTIVLCANHQKRIVDDILTLSKLDASLLVMSPDKVQVPQLITKALKMYEAEIERADIDAQLVIEPTYEELKVDWVVLDPSRLLQVIINLLTNSIKFTQYAETRKIKICLGASYQEPTGKHHGISFIPSRQSRPSRTPRSELEGGEDIYLQFAVYDTGSGLSEEEMKLLFQRFQQASPKTYKQYGGSGLGLFISRELCELQGGQIGVASRSGQTVFVFFVKSKHWLPETVAALRPVPARYTSAAASPVVFSRRGSSVLNDAESQMSAPRTLKNGNVVEDFVPQPSLRPTSTSSQNRQAETQILQTNDQEGKQDMHVLIVEDNLINQKVMSQQLRRAGCIVHVANHGLECLTFLENSTFCGADTPLSIILLDLEMPTMNGLECIRHIRERQAAGSIRRHVPVIAVTANARSEQIATAIEAGMDQVVTKPFRIPELVPQMQSLVAEAAVGKGSA